MYTYNSYHKELFANTWILEIDNNVTNNPTEKK